MTLTKIASTGIEDSLRWVLGANGTSDYTFTGPGLTGTVNDPTIYLTRGHTYIFQNNSGGHPFYIKTSTANGGTNDAYNTGVTNNGGGNGTEIVFTVPHDSPDILYYQCSSHASMAGQFNIAGSVADGSISTSKLADDAVNNDKLANSVVASIAANTAKTTNATHTGDVTGSTSLTIANDAVTTDKIADNAVTRAQIVDGAINGAKCQNQSIGAEKLTDGTIDNGDISASANIAGSKLADDSISLAKLEHGTSSNDGKFLRANNGADPTFETVTGTTISGNADNRVITGSDTANTLNGEADVTYNGSTSDFSISGSKPGVSMDLIVQNSGGGNAAGARITIESGSAANTGPQFGMICGSDNWYLQTPKTVGALDFHKNGTRTFRLKGDGDVELSDGDLVIGTSGHGIDFSATSNTSATNASMTNELFADYEIGTWTPVIRYYSNGSWPQATTSVAGTITGCYYVKIGNMCYFHLGWDGFTVTNSSYAVIGGLPFPSAGRGSCLVHYTNLFNNHQDQGGHISGGSADQIEFYRDSNNWNSIQNNTSNRYIYADGRYYVN